MPYRARRRVAVTCAVIMFAATACSTSTPSEIGTSGAHHSAPATSARTSTAPHRARHETFPTTRSALTRLVHKAVAHVTSAHVTIQQLGSDGMTVLAGDEHVATGVITALDFSKSVGDGPKTQIIISGGTTYVRFPSAHTTSRPWIKPSKRSSDAQVRALYTALQVLTAASNASVSDYLHASTGFARTGTATLSGTPVATYAMTVAIAQLPDDYELKAALLNSNISTFSVQLSVDAQGRARQVNISVDINGTSATTRASLGDYNRPVKITAPPASQVRAS